MKTQSCWEINITNSLNKEQSCWTSLNSKRTRDSLDIQWKQHRKLIYSILYLVFSSDLLMFCSLSLCGCWRPTTLKIQLRLSWRILAQTIPNKQSCVERPCLITKWLDLYYQNNIPWNMTFLIHSIFILMKFTNVINS